MKRVMLLAIVLVMFGKTASAAPGVIGSWLIKQPASLWDVGMLNLSGRAHFAALELNRLLNVDGVVRTSYSWNDDKISVLYFAPLKTSTLGTCNELRKKFITRFIGLIDHTKLDETAENFMENVFSHAGFKTKEAPLYIGVNMARITNVKVVVPSAGDSPCEGSLLDWESVKETK